MCSFVCDASASGLRWTFNPTGAVFVEFSYQSGQINLRISCLKPAFHRSLRQSLEFISARALQKEIRIATDVLNGRECDCIHPLLYNCTTRCGKPGNPKSERPDEIVKVFSWQRSIDPAVRCGQIRVVILRTQHHFERATTAHQPREVLGAACAGDNTERWFELTKNC